MWVVLGIVVGFSCRTPCFDEDDKAIGCGDEEAGTDKEPLVAATHNAEGNIDGIADEVAYPGVDVLAHHKERGDGLERENGAVEHGQVGVQHTGIEEEGGGGNAYHCQQRPQRVAPTDGATVVLRLFLPDEDPADGGKDAVNLEGETHKVVVGEEIVAQYQSGDNAEHPCPAVATGGKVDGGNLRDGDEYGEDGFEIHFV